MESAGEVHGLGGDGEDAACPEMMLWGRVFMLTPRLGRDRAERSVGSALSLFLLRKSFAKSPTPQFQP